MSDFLSQDNLQSASEPAPSRLDTVLAPNELLRLYEAERAARITAEQRLDNALREHRDARRIAALHDYVMASAHCLLWYADIYETNVEYLHWEMTFPNLEAVRNFVSIEIKPGETLKQAWYSCRFPEDRDACDRIGTAAVRAGNSYQQEFRCVCEDGSIRWLHEDVRVETVVEGKYWRAVGVCTDITAQREREARMEAANQRLKRSLAETHHRVKNNLQVVASLVEMQTGEEGQSVEAQATFQRMSQQIRSLAAIHDLLTLQARADTEVDAVSVRAVLQKLVTLAGDTMGRRNIKMRTVDLRLPLHQVTALVVLVNELLSNAVKYSQGELEIDLDVDAGMAHLEICDDGPGFPQDFDPKRYANTGLEIVESIGRWDLQGTLLYETRVDGGARVTLEFPVRPDTVTAEAGQQAKGWIWEEPRQLA